MVNKSERSLKSFLYLRAKVTKIELVIALIINTAYL